MKVTQFSIFKCFKSLDMYFWELMSYVNNVLKNIVYVQHFDFGHLKIRKSEVNFGCMNITNDKNVEFHLKIIDIFVYQLKWGKLLIEFQSFIDFKFQKLVGNH
jgi:hypothetical protein